MKAQDIYIKLTDPTGKHSDVINHHRVWDKNKFYQSQVKLHENKEKPIGDQRTVSLATESDYNAMRKIKK